MAYGFDDFKTYLKIRMGRRTDIESVDGVNLYEIIINKAYKEVVTKNRFWELKHKFTFPELDTVDTSQSTTDGVNYLTTPTGYLIVTDVYDSSNDVWLDKFASWREFLRKTNRTDTDQEGTPSKWIRSGERIYLHMTPDDAYTTEIYYRKIPDDLTGTDETVVNEIWDEPILELAANKLHRILGEYEKAKECKEAFIDIVEGIIGLESQEKEGARQFIRPNVVYKRNRY
jgi:hypothetical protein